MLAAALRSFLPAPLRRLNMLLAMLWLRTPFLMSACSA
jgi:hypothetical protein